MNLERGENQCDDMDASVQCADQSGVCASTSGAKEGYESKGGHDEIVADVVGSLL